jgi:hypothetical protein
MEIGISTDQLIDIGLNVIGFMASGLLCATVYSLFSKRGQQSSEQAASEIMPAATMSAPVSSNQTQDSRRYEFVTFKSPGDKAVAPIRETSSEDRYRTRDRQEILRQARELLARKKGVSEIGETLPITEAEISFLKQNLNLQGLARS